MRLIIIINSSCRLIRRLIAIWNSTVLSSTCVLIPVVITGAVVESCLPYRDYFCLLNAMHTNDHKSLLLLLLLHNLEGIGLGV